MDPTTYSNFNFNNFQVARDEFRVLVNQFKELDDKIKAVELQLKPLKDERNKLKKSIQVSMESGHKQVCLMSEGTEQISVVKKAKIGKPKKEVAIQRMATYMNSDDVTYATGLYEYTFEQGEKVYTTTFKREETQLGKMRKNEDSMVLSQDSVFTV